MPSAIRQANRRAQQQRRSSRAALALQPLLDGNRAGAVGIREQAFSSSFVLTSIGILRRTAEQWTRLEPQTCPGPACPADPRSRKKLRASVRQHSCPNQGICQSSTMLAPRHHYHVGTKTVGKCDATVADLAYREAHAMTRTKVRPRLVAAYHQTDSNHQTGVEGMP